MSIFFDITHTTHYRYAQPVTLGEHRVLFRPRDSHDLRVLATDMQVSPEPVCAICGHGSQIKGGAIKAR